MAGKLGAEKMRQQPNGTDKQQRNDLNNGFAVASAEREAPYNPKRDEPKKKACHPVKEVSRVRHFLSHSAYFWLPSGRRPACIFICLSFLGPTTGPYDFAKVQGKLLIVNASDRTIAEVISG
jgi:hypothetical protein